MSKIIIELELEGDNDGELARDWIAYYLDGGGEQQFLDAPEPLPEGCGETKNIRIVKREEENTDEVLWKWK